MNGFNKILLLMLLGAFGFGLTVGAQTGRAPQSGQDRPPTTPSAPDPGAPNVLAESNSDYRIAPGDVIEILVEDAPELSRHYRVNAAGNFDMQILGRITAKRKTTEELGRLIADALRGQDYLKSPNVVVSVKQYNSQTFFIQGAVNRPGVYQIEGNPSLLMMISLAGGLADNHGATAFIIRKKKEVESDLAATATAVVAKPPTSQQTGQPNAAEPAGLSDPDLMPDYELLRLNLSGLYKGQFQQNQMLEPGDIVNIPRTDVFFVAGEVQMPGSFPLKEGTTLRQAVSLAQGMTFKAKAANGIIFREDPNSGRRQEIKVDVSAVMSGKKEDIAILANDVIIVPNSRTKSVGSTLMMAFGMSALTRIPVR